MPPSGLATSLPVSWALTPRRRGLSPAGPLDQLDQFNNYRLSPLTFGARDLTPVGYAAFAFALGVTIGLLLRRAVPAIAVTLAVFAAVQVAVPLEVRPYLIPPVRTVSALSTSNGTRTVTFFGNTCR